MILNEENDQNLNFDDQDLKDPEPENKIEKKQETIDKIFDHGVNKAVLDKELVEIFLKLIDFILSEIKKNISQLFDTKVKISSPLIEIKDKAMLKQALIFNQSFVPLSYIRTAFDHFDVKGENAYFLTLKDSFLLLQCYLKDENLDELDPNEFEWTPEYVDALKEFFIYIVTQFNNVLSQKLNYIILTDPVEASIIDNIENLEYQFESMENQWIYIKYDIHIQDKKPVTINQILNFSIFEKIMSFLEKKFHNLEIKNQGSNQHELSENELQNLFKTGQGVKISSVYYQNLPNLKVNESLSKGSISLLLDLEMKLTIELGRAKMKIYKIMNLGEGSVIELNKLAGEPVDLLINKKIIAKGEVVVIDQNFGVRITEIVGTGKRIETVF